VSAHPVPVAAPGRAGGGGLRALLEHRARILAGGALVALAVGGALHLAGAGGAGDAVWIVAVLLLASELAAEVVRTIAVERHMGVDTIALIAMVGALALHQELAGLVVGLMFSGGAALEERRVGAGAPRADAADPARADERSRARTSASRWAPPGRRCPRRPRTR